MAKNKERADEALRAAYTQHYAAVLKYAAVRLQYAAESAEDCVQNTFIVYYRRMLDGEDIQSPRAFLYRTCDNFCKNADRSFLRKAKRTAPLEEISAVPSPDTDALAPLLDYDEIRLQLLSLLTDEEQEMYRLKYEEHRTLKEIGAFYGISPNAAALRLTRLRSKIKALVEPTINRYREGG